MKNGKWLRLTGFAAILSLTLGTIVYAAGGGGVLFGYVPGAYSSATGTSVLPTGQKITPAGQQVKLTHNMPLGMDISPDKKFMAISSNGEEKKGISIVDLNTNQELYFIPQDPLFMGVKFSKDGSKLYASGGGANKVYVYSVNMPDRYFSLQKSIDVLGFPGGMAMSPDGNDLFVADNLGNTVTDISTITDTPVTALPSGNSPYTCQVSPDGKQVLVSNWGDRTVSVYNRIIPNSIANPTAPPQTGPITPVGTVPVGEHPTAIAMNQDGSTVYVTNGNTDNVSVLKKGADGAWVEDTRIDTDPEFKNRFPNQKSLYSAIPNALALSPDGKTLYVADGGLNALTVIDTATQAVKGYIPTGWWPSEVRISSDGSKIYVLNAKGVGGGPTVNGENLASLITGSMSVIPVPAAETLSQYTQQFVQNNRYDKPPAAVSNVVPNQEGVGSDKIKHVVMIIRENKTYDQEFGDIAAGNGDPNLVMYGEKNTPNSHAMAKRWSLLDNYFTDTEVSITGHFYLNAGQLTDYAEKTWSNDLMWSDSNQSRIPDQGSTSTSFPHSGFLVDQAIKKGKSFRIYGFEGKQVSADPNNLQTIAAHTCPTVPHGFIMGYPDTTRAKATIEDMKQNGLADLSIIWLPEDHTLGGLPGYWSPQSMVADNDYATGMILDHLSHSPDWNSTAVIVQEDDPQSGRDHVEGHRSIFMAASPWAMKNNVSHNLYDQSSVLHTIELILGLPYMNQFDALATPMNELFINSNATPDLTPYDAIQPQIGMVLNPDIGPFVERSKLIDWNQVDRNEEEVQSLLWDMIKGK